MDEILCGLPFVFVYLDEMLIASRTHEEHMQHLQQVLTIFKQHGLVLNGEKCVLGASTVDYLGHKVTAEGISPLPDCVAAIKKFPQPATVQQLQTYLGMLSFYHLFIKGTACVLKPLTDALRGSQWTKLDWTADMLVAFNTSRALLSNITQLAHLHPAVELVLSVDASSMHVGAVLQQHASVSGLQPLSFFSCKLDSGQYSAQVFSFRQGAPSGLPEAGPREILRPPV